MEPLNLRFIDEAPSIMATDIDDSRERIRDWLLAIKATTGDSWPAIAERGGVSKSTIYRAVTDEGDFVMSTRNVDAIAKAYNVPPPGGGAPSGGFAEAEAEAELVAEDISREIRGGGRERLPAHLHVWLLNSRALELAGYLAGDFLTVDFNAAPAAGDVVCAQVYNFERGTAETVFRLYEPPYLTTASLERRKTFTPLLIDGERVSVRGVVVETVRRRKSV